MNEQTGRDFLRTSQWDKFGSIITDQQRAIPEPPPEKPIPEGAKVIALPSGVAPELGNMSVRDALVSRKSHRRFTNESITLAELAFLLWAVQGVKKPNVAYYRTAPSAGARHPFETYVFAHRVDGVESGLYRYLPLSHRLCFLKPGDFVETLITGSFGQIFVGECAVTFVWTAIPYRTEWRYERVSPKIIAIDIGHVCQNLYLAAESIGCGTCAIGAYSQQLMDAAVEADGQDEFVVYAAPVGRV